MPFCQSSPVTSTEASAALAVLRSLQLLPDSVRHRLPRGLTLRARHATADAGRGSRFDRAVLLSPSPRERLHPRAPRPGNPPVAPAGDDYVSVAVQARTGGATGVFRARSVEEPDRGPLVYISRPDPGGFRPTTEHRGRLPPVDNTDRPAGRQDLKATKRKRGEMGLGVERTTSTAPARSRASGVRRSGRSQPVVGR
jgi:hypothetical protein